MLRIWHAGLTVFAGVLAFAGPALAQGNGYYQSAHTIHFYDQPYPDYRPAYPSYSGAQGYYYMNRTQYSYGEPYPDYGYRYYPYYYGYYQPIPQQTSAGYGKVTVSVPQDAQVTFNDLTSPEGYVRRWFETPALRGDRDFTVKIHAVWTEGDAKVERTRTVTLHAGDSMKIDLAGQASASESQKGSQAKGS
jgi:uncharacterized protein (TIGR03000 family)